MSEKNVLETGSYVITGPDNGEIKMDSLYLKGDNDANRVWKVKSMNEKEIILEIVKFG